MLVGFWLFDFLIVDASIAPAWIWPRCGLGLVGVVLFRIELIVLCVLLIGLYCKRPLTELERLPVLGFVPLGWVVCLCVLVVCCGQVVKGTWWMPWHREPMKDVGACEMPWGVGNRALIRGCPNGETQHESCRVTCT